MINDYVKFIKTLREKKGISQLQIAKQLGISRASYIAIEQGKREITLGELERLAEILGVSIQDIKHGEIPKYTKYKQMIHAFLRLNTSLPKTKLAKLLYFADFAWYYKHLESMSGMQYRKIQYGPVADTYFRLIDEMFDGGEIVIEKKSTQTGNEAMLISETRAGAKGGLSDLSKSELSLIQDINKKWKDKPTKDIVSFTHKQMPYIFAEDNDIVSYEVFGQENPEDIY